MTVSSNGAQNTSILKLVKSVSSDAQKLLKAQGELATTELKGSQKEATATGGMFAGAAVFGGLGLVFLLVTFAYVLVQLGLPTWAGFGIVTAFLLIVALILGLVGRSRAKKIKGPELAKAEWERTKLALSGKQPEVLPATRSTSTVAQRAGDVARS